MFTRVKQHWQHVPLTLPTNTNTQLKWLSAAYYTLSFTRFPIKPCSIAYSLGLFFPPFFQQTLRDVSLHEYYLCYPCWCRCLYWESAFYFVDNVLDLKLVLLCLGRKWCAILMVLLRNLCDPGCNRTWPPYESFYLSYHNIIV